MEALLLTQDTILYVLVQSELAAADEARYLGLLLLLFDDVVVDADHLDERVG